MADAVATSSSSASLLQILKQTGKEWMEDGAPRLGAALAYYATFSIAPLMLLTIAVASVFLGEDAARGQLQDQLHGYLGKNGAEAVQALLSSAKKSEGSGTVAVIIGVVTLLWGASGVFGELKESLNTIWGVTEKKSGVKNFLLNRLLSYVMVLLIGLLLVAAAIASTAVSAVMKYAQVPTKLGHLSDFGLSFLLLTILFGIIFKVMPDVKLRWRNVWLGAAVTSVLFSLGKMAIGFYLTRGGIANSYGAAGSVLVLMIWVYYSAQIFFFGAEFTQVYSKLRSIPAEPSDTGVLCEDAEAEGVAPKAEKKATALAA